GAVKIAPGISAITEDGAIFEGGRQDSFDAIIFATGYRPNYRSFLEADDIVASNDRMRNRKNGNLTIYFVGFRSPVSGLLREISKEAVQVADKIVHQRKR